MIGRALYSQVLYPAYHGARRDGVLGANRRAAASQWWDAEELAEHQHARLARLLRFAASHVPFYRDAIRSLGASPDELAASGGWRALPVQTKDLIRREGSRLRAEPEGGRRAFANSTSGSTGEPLRFLTDAVSHSLRRADELRGKTWTGYRLGDREIALWQSPLDLGRAKKLRGRLHALVTRYSVLSSFDLTPARMDAYLAQIRRLRPRLLLAYPSALEVFARHCAERGERDVLIGAAIVTSAESLWDYQRALFADTFGVPVFNRYGCREVGPIAHECEAHRHLHVSADRLLLEIVDADGAPCPPGQWGELLITDLENLAMPFIRYQIGDRAAWAPSETCACGRGLPMLLGVEGRSMDVIRSPAGGVVGGTFWTVLLRSRPGLRQFQVVQEADGAITVRYVPDESFTPGVLDYFTTRVRETLGDSMAVRYDRVEKIRLSASGKLRLVESRYRQRATVKE